MPYCTVQDLEGLLSGDGVDAFSDNDGDGHADPDVIEAAIAQATDEIDFKLHQRYDPSQLEQSGIINRWATTLAAYYLSMKRGNPPPESILIEFERIFSNSNSELNQIRDGKNRLPGLIPTSGTAPSVSNMVIDRRYSTPQKVSHSTDRHNRSTNRPARY